MAKSNISFKWNKTKSVLIYDKGFTPDFYLDEANICLRHMMKYTPYDPFREFGTHLADSTRITGYPDHATITYVKPYTRPVYTGVHPNGFSRYSYQTSVHSPLATSYWDKACWTNEGAAIVQQVNKARISHAR